MRFQLTTLMVLCLATAATAAPPVRFGGEDKSGALARRFAEAGRSVRAGQWQEAVNEYLQILSEAGDELVSAGPRESIVARRVCHLRLSELPPPGMQIYRERVDAKALRLVEEGETNRDPVPLRRVVDEMFCSRSGDHALDLLGDLAFEQGKFEEAEEWWQFLSLSTAGKKESRSLYPLLFPDPRVDIARVRAKQLLARWFRGDISTMTEELKAFREIHGKHAGVFAGRTGNYADALEALSCQSAVAARKRLEPWTTFAGNSSRNMVAVQTPGRLDRGLPPGPPTRTWALHSSKGSGKGFTYRAGKNLDSPFLQSIEARSLAYHPLVLGEHVLVADDRSVTAFDLRQDTQAVWFDIQRDGGNGESPPTFPETPEPGARFTMTVDRERVFVRMGAQKAVVSNVVGMKQEKEDQNFSSLVCLDRHADKNGSHLRWTEKPKSAVGSVFYEGSPVVYQGRVFIAITRQDRVSRSTSIACYDAETGLARWPQPVDICDAVRSQDAEAEFPTGLLTVAGTRIIFCTHSGAVVALDPLTGRRLWAARYPSRGVRTLFGEPSPRDLAPCVYADHRILVAPADYDRIFCLDPEDGRLLWESDISVEAVHMLGVAGGNLIFTTPSDIRAMSVADGKHLPFWRQPDSGEKLASFGRGFLAGDVVLWPTDNGLRVLDQKTGGLRYVENFDFFASGFDSRPLRGNLAYGNHCLVVADSDQLRAYLPPAFFLQEREKETQRHPGEVLPWYLLGQAEAGLKRFDRAQADFRQAEKSARPGERYQGTLVKELARAERHHLLMDRAEDARGEKKWAEARTYFSQGEGEEFLPAQRIDALMAGADLEKEVGEPSQAVAKYQDILADKRLRHELIKDDGEMRQTAGKRAAFLIQELIKRHGPNVYEEWEKKAFVLVNSTGPNTILSLERLVEEFPNSNYHRSALLRLADLEEKEGRFAAAARHYRSLLNETPATSADRHGRALTLVGLARSYEQGFFWQDARVTWEKLAFEQGDRVLDVLDAGKSVQEFVRERLHQPGYLPSSVPTPDFSFPLGLIREIALDLGETLLVHESTPLPESATDYLFFTRSQNGREKVLCREAASGRTCWEQEVLFPPTWVGRRGDVVILGGNQGAAGLSVADGGVCWNMGSASLGPHRLIGDLVLFLEDNRRLLALDAKTGQVHWRFSAPGAAVRPSYPYGRFSPFFWADEQTVLLQTELGQRFVLESLTGKEISKGLAGKEGWRAFPYSLGKDRLVVVKDSRHVALVDAASGRELWEHETRTPTVSLRPPQVLGNAKFLFVLIDGWELSRLDVSTGHALWERSVPPNARIACLDENRVYLTHSHGLMAFNSDSGKVRWTLATPGESVSWRALRARNSLVVYPEKPQGKLLWSWVFAGKQFLPFPREIDWQPLKLFFLDPNEGKIQQQLTFPTAGPGAAIEIHPQQAIIVQDQKMECWASTSRKPS